MSGEGFGMKVFFAIFAAAAFACHAAAQQHYERPDPVLTAEQLAMTEKAAPKRLLAAPAKIRRFLVWSRTEGARHGEGIVAFNALLKVLEKNSGGKWEMVFADEPEPHFSSVENLRKFDCVVLNNTTGRFFESYRDVYEKMSEEEKKADRVRNFKYRDNLIEYVRQGGGVMGVHAACDAMDCKDPSNPSEKSPAYPLMMGGRFAGHPWGAGNSPVTVLVEDASSPLTRGIWPDGEFRIQDEIYTYREDDPKTGVSYGYGRDRQRMLLGLDFDRSPKDGSKDPMAETSRKTKDFGLGWIKDFGKGRVFYGAFGHRIDVYWRNPGICEFYMRGLQYASGDLKADAAPLGKAGFEKAMAASVINSVKTLRNVEYGEPVNPIENAVFRAYKAAGESPEAAARLERLCVDELKSGAGTNRYLKLCSEILQFVGANSTAAEVGGVIARDSAPGADPKARHYTESLFIALARSRDPEAGAVLRKLADSKFKSVAVGALSAIGYRKNPADAEFLWKKFASARSDAEAWAAVSALAETGAPGVFSRLSEACFSARGGALKNRIGALAFSNSGAAPGELAAFASKVAADKSAPEGLRAMAAVELLKSGKVCEGARMENLIRFLARNPGVKIPEEMSLSRLPEGLKPPMIYALVARNEGRDEVLGCVPESGEAAVAYCYAVSQWGADSSLEKAFSLAPLMDEKQMRHAAFVLSAIKSPGKLMKIMSLMPRLGGKGAELASKAASFVDASDSFDGLFGIVEGPSGEAEKRAAIRALENASLRNSEVFVRMAGVYPKLPEALRRDAMLLMVACSRRGCDAEMVAAAAALMDRAKTPSEKRKFFRFATANMSRPGAEMLVSAYRKGMRAEALAELSSWTDPSALGPMVELDKSLRDTRERLGVQRAIVKLLPRADALESDAARHIMENAVDKKDARLVEKMARLNLSGRAVSNLPGGGSATACAEEGDVGKMFDYDENSKWSTKRPCKSGDWIQFSFDAEKPVAAIRVDPGSSKNDGLISPRLFGGLDMEDFAEIPFSLGKDGDVDVMRLEKPMKLKMVRIEQGGDRGNWWTVAEIIPVLEESAYSGSLKPYGGGISAGASHGADAVKFAFDGADKTRWSTNCRRFPGQWFLLKFDKPRKVGFVDLILKDSVGDRIRKPRVFIGDSLDDMRIADVKYEKKMDRDRFVFAEPGTPRFIRIENGEASGNFWSFHAIEVK